MILLVVGSLLIFVPIVWDVLSSTFAVLANIHLDDLFAQTGLFVVGVTLLGIVGAREAYQEFTNKTKSKYIK